MDAETTLKEVSAQVSVCEKCALHFSRKRSVPGEGPSNAEIMFIGEGPGFYENEQGRPFVGAAGKFLDELLAKSGLQRETVFITNVVKCRPPGNRDPLPEELTACGLFLDRQIEVIAPRVIVTLGRYSMAKYLPMAKISGVHGQATWVRGRLIVPMYHPAAALHQPALKGALEQDFSRLQGFIQQARQAQQAQQPHNTPAVRQPVSTPTTLQPVLTADVQQPDAPQPAPSPTSSEPSSPHDEEPTQLSLF